MKRSIQHGRKEEAQRGARRAQMVREVLSDLAPDVHGVSIGSGRASILAVQDYVLLPDGGIAWGPDLAEVR